jgi:signal transduction histidine kinase
LSAPADPSAALAQALRTGATRAARAAGGGLVLVFASENGSDDVKLRSAAGFAAPDQARKAGVALASHVGEALNGSGVYEIEADGLGLGARAAGGVRIHPVRLGAQRYGAVAVGSPEVPTAEQVDRVAEVVETIALHFDHARIARDCDALRAQVVAVPEFASEPEGAGQSDEVLRLSEALFAQDIELLRSTEKLGKIERLKNDFIEKMSRELRTPLNSIIEAIISVLTGENDSLSEGAKTALRSALDEGSAFLRTLQNILDLWKIKQGELPVETQDVNFRELVDEAIFSIQDSIGDKPLRIETELVEPFPRLRTDLTKLNQILFLLLDNAAKFTPEGRIVIRGRVAEGKLLVAIEDEGIGICHDDMQFVFDEFYQVDEPASQKYRGAGLGLTLVRDLVTLLRGEISLQSDIGRGTTVAFSIPLDA